METDRLVTVITLRGEPLTPELIDALKKLGVVNIQTFPLTETITTPPPVLINENCYVHTRGNFGLRMLIDKLTDQDVTQRVTLIHNQMYGIFVRIYNDIVYVASRIDNERVIYATIGFENFMKSIEFRNSQSMSSSIRDMLADQKIRSRFIQEPITVLLGEALSWMNWDGYHPGKSVTGFETRKYLSKNSLGANIFLKMVEAGMTHLNEHWERIIVFDYEKVWIFKDENGMGKLYGMSKKIFMKAFQATTGNNVNIRLLKLLGIVQNFLTEPKEMDIEQALEEMKWDGISKGETQ